MEEGIYIFTLPGHGGYYACNPAFVGWLRHVGGDDWESMPGRRRLIRQSGKRDLMQLAHEGPREDHWIGPAAEGKEYLHRLASFRRVIPADEKNWKKACPRPKDWDALTKKES